MSFDGLGLSPELLRAVVRRGLHDPHPGPGARQSPPSSTAATCSPAPRPAPARRPRSSCRSSRTSTRPAATAAEKRHRVRVLVVVPTRELAIQVEESVRTYGTHRPVRSATVYGGVGFGPQITKLRAGPEVVVATPGRLLDHVGQRTIDLSAVEVLVLDEADRMLDMGFIRDIRKILALLPPRRQNLLFSATFSDEVRGLADGLLHDPAHGSRSRRATPPTELIDQLVDPGRPRAQARPPARARRAGPRRSRRSCSPAPSTARTASPCSSRRTASGPPRSTATRASRSGCKRARRLQGRPRRPARRDRRGRARHRHRAAAARHQLRAADGRRGLRPPDRPHRSRRRRRAGDLARVHRRAAAPPARSSSCSAGRSRWRTIAGLRARPLAAPPADPAAVDARGTSRDRREPRRPWWRPAGRTAVGRPATRGRTPGAGHPARQRPAPRRRGVRLAPERCLGRATAAQRPAPAPVTRWALGRTRDGLRQRRPGRAQRPAAPRRPPAPGPRRVVARRSRVEPRVRLGRRTPLDAGRAHQPPRLAIGRREAPASPDLSPRG